MGVDEKGEPPATYVDIITGATYFPRVVGYGIPDASGQPTVAYEATFYFVEGVTDQGQAMAMLADIMLRRYMMESGRKVDLQVEQKLAPNGARPSGLVLP